MAFCTNCGNQLADDVAFCPKCGTSTNGQAQQPNQNTAQNGYQQQYQQYQQPYQQPYQSYVPMKNIVQQLSGKVKAEAIIWLVIACIQYLLALINLGIGSYIYGLIVLVIAIINTVFSVQRFKYSTEVLVRPVGIVNKYRPVGGIVGTLIYNVLFGGLIGVVGSIYAFVVRSFVITNEMQFAQIEQQFIEQNQQA